jgi:hypothetical protein
MDPAARPTPSPLQLDRVLTSLLVLGAVFYSVFLYRAGSPIAGGADSSGYLNSARLLGEGRLFGAVRQPTDSGSAHFSLSAFQPLGFSIDPKLPRMAPTYPLGLPLHLLAAAAIAGWDRAALLVNIFAAVGGGGMLWLLARYFKFPPAWAAIAVAWLWLCPLLVFCALQPMSDALALLWSLAVLYTALRTREGAGWCLACGAALAMAVLVRPTNALLFIPVLVALGFRLKSGLWLILGGLPGAIFLGCYNHEMYGAVFTTGYGDIGADLGSRFLLHNLGHFARWIPGLLSPLVCAGLALPFLAGSWTREGKVLALWVALLLGFYAFYFHTGEAWWYLRFILPAFPLLILAATAVGQKIPIRSPAAQTGLLAALVIVTAAWEMKFNRELDPVFVAEQEQSYRLSADWARQNLPATSAIFCMQVSGAFYFYTDFLIVRWELVETGDIGPLFAALQQQHRPAYAILYEFEQAAALQRLGGHWKKITAVGVTTVWHKED